MKRILITATILVALLSQTIASPASAASKGWRYWSYYHAASVSKGWEVANTGATVDIADGSVEGWKFIFDGAASSSTPPSVKPDFATICATTKKQAGFKRVGLVVDFGGKAYAPKGEKVQKTFVRCVLTSKESQGIDVLIQELDLRSSDSGLICGFNGYPAKECGVEIKTPATLLKK